MSVLYDLDPAVREVVRGSGGSPGLTHRRGAFRQEGSARHLFAGGRDARHRVGKLSGRELAGMSSHQMAAAMRRAIDGSCVIRGRDYGCRSHLVFIDEINRLYHDGERNPAARLRAKIRPADPGAKLSYAMKLLDVPSPHGGTYAERVHFYVAPNMVSGMAKGRGPLRDLGRDGRPHFPTWRAVLPGLARGGGVWLEMYHFRGGSRTPFTAREWRVGPRAFDGLFRRAGGSTDRVHFMISGVGTPPGRKPRCGGAMSCQWALADLPGVNRSILRNGVGAYRLGGHAGAWLRQYNRRVPG